MEKKDRTLAGVFILTGCLKFRYEDPARMHSKPETDPAMTETNQNRVFIPTKPATESRTFSHVRIWNEIHGFNTSFSKENSE